MKRNAVLMLICALALTVMFAAGCGPDANDPPDGTPRVTLAPTEEATARPSETPGETGPVNTQENTGETPSNATEAPSEDPDATVPGTIDLPEIDY